MNSVEALATVELIEVEWPTVKLPDDTKRQWATDLVSYEPSATMADGYEAVRAIASSQVFCPRLIEVLRAVRAAQRERLRREAESQPVLPGPPGVSLSEFLAANPGVHDRVRRLGWWHDTLDELAADL